VAENQQLKNKNDDLTRKNKKLTDSAKKNAEQMGILKNELNEEILLEDQNPTLPYLSPINYYRKIECDTMYIVNQGQGNKHGSGRN